MLTAYSPAVYLLGTKCANEHHIDGTGFRLDNPADVSKVGNNARSVPTGLHPRAGGGDQNSTLGRTVDCGVSRPALKFHCGLVIRPHPCGLETEILIQISRRASRRSSAAAATTPPIIAPVMPGDTKSWPVRNSPGVGVRAESAVERNRRGVTSRP